MRRPRSTVPSGTVGRGLPGTRSRARSCGQVGGGQGGRGGVALGDEGADGAEPLVAGGVEVGPGRASARAGRAGRPCTAASWACRRRWSSVRALPSVVEATSASRAAARSGRSAPAAAWPMAARPVGGWALRRRSARLRSCWVRPGTSSMATSTGRIGRSPWVSLTRPSTTGAERAGLDVCAHRTWEAVSWRRRRRRRGGRGRGRPPPNPRRVRAATPRAGGCGPASAAARPSAETLDGRPRTFCGGSWPRAANAAEGGVDGGDEVVEVGGLELAEHGALLAGLGLPHSVDAGVEAVELDADGPPLAEGLVGLRHEEREHDSLTRSCAACSGSTRPSGLPSRSRAPTRRVTGTWSRSWRHILATLLLRSSTTAR
jgi:hypothetical protein